MIGALSPPPRRILAINFGGIGDEVLFFPTLESLRHTYPEARLAVLVEPRCRAIIQYAPVPVDEVLTFDVKGKPTWGELMDLLGRLRQGAYDLVVSSGQSSLVAALLFLSGARHRVGYAGSQLDWLLTSRVRLRKQQYAADMYHDLARGAGVDRRAPLPRMRVPAAALAWADEWLAARGLVPDARPMVLHPGSSALSQRLKMLKDWPVSEWVDLIGRLHGAGYRVVLASGPDDRQVVAEILARVGDQVVPTGEDLSSLERLAGLVARAALLVCIDSAPLHFAVATGTPAVAVFGPTDPRKLVPADPRYAAVTAGFDLPCGLQPCLWERRQTTCDDRQCLERLPAARVFEAVRERLPLPAAAAAT